MNNKIHVYIKYILGVCNILPSLSKMLLLRFASPPNIDDPTNSMFRFFDILYIGKPYWFFIGLSQFIAGILLCSLTYSLYGAIISSILFLNIFFITISYLGFGLTKINAFVLLLTSIYFVIIEVKLRLNVNENKKYFIISTCQVYRKNDIRIGVAIIVVTILFYTITGILFRNN